MLLNKSKLLLKKYYGALPLLRTVRYWMTVCAMKKKKTGRAPDRIRKTIPFPDALAEQIQAIADEKYHGDFTRAVLEEMAKAYPAARKFLRTNTTWKHSAKK